MSTLPEGWIPFGEATSWLKHHLMVNDSNFVLDHWDCKYVVARIDMRTGAMLLWAGNDRTTLPFGSTDKVSFSAGGTTRMDQVNSPPHYNRGEKCPNCGHGIECIDVTEHRDFLVGNAIKYLWRAGAKDDFVKDLRKAAWYIERKIAQLEGPVEVK